MFNQIVENNRVEESLLRHTKEKTKKRNLSLTTLAWRNLFTRPRRTLLTIIGIALGVAAVLSTSITNRNVSKTIENLFIRTVGAADLKIFPIGEETLMDDFILEVVQRNQDISLAVPIIRTITVLPGSIPEGESVHNASGFVEMGKSIQIEGIDPLLDPEMRVYILHEGKLPQLGKYEIAISQTFAENQELSIGETISLFGASETQKFTITGILANEGAAMTNSGNAIFAPIDIVGSFFNENEGYSEISIRAQSKISEDPQRLASLKTSLESCLKNYARVNYPAAKAEQVPRMANTYQFTLAFFSVLAFFMGSFLIYNTFNATVYERTLEIGILRALGMERRQIIAQILMEAGFLSILGCLLGFITGILLAQGLMALMRGFFQVESSLFSFTFLDLVKSASIGLLGTFFSTLFPAKKAANIPPVEALTIRATADQKLNPLVWKVGFGLFVIGGTSLFLPLSGSTEFLLALRLTFLILFLLGVVLSVPLAIKLLFPFIKKIGIIFYGVVGGLGARNLKRSTIRTMVTVASLSISLIMIIQVNALVFIIKEDITQWLDNALGADIILRAPSPIRQDFTLSLEKIDGVEAATASRTIEVQVGQDSMTPARQQVETLFFNAIDPKNYRNVGDKEFVSGQGNPEVIWKNFEQGGTVFISSVIADEFDLKAGDFFSLVTNQGQKPFRVAGITTEFNQSGLVLTGSFTDLRRYFGEYEADLFILKITPGYDIDHIAKAIGDYYGDRKGIQVTTTHAFKIGVLAFYDSLTNLFNVLSWVGLIIGIIGLLNTMSMNILERKRELGMLRALGSLQKQIIRLVLAEALMIGLISAIYGIVFGYILSHVLVAAANLISGYDLQYTFSAQPFLLSLLIGIAVSQFATLVPARRASQINIIEALKYE